MQSWAWAIIVTMVIFFIVVVVVAFIHLKDESDPRPGVASHRGKEPRMTQPNGPQETMYDRVAGEVGIRAWVDRGYYYVLADEELAPFFPRTAEGLDTLRRHFALMIGQVLGGPRHVEDAGAYLSHAHRNLGITPTVYWRTISHFLRAAAELGVPSDIIGAVASTSADLEDVIIQEPVMIPPATPEDFVR